MKQTWKFITTSKRPIHDILALSYTIKLVPADSSQRFYKIFTPSFTLPLIKLFNVREGGGSGESRREIYNFLN